MGEGRWRKEKKGRRRGERKWRRRRRSRRRRRRRNATPGKEKQKHAAGILNSAPCLHVQTLGAGLSCYKCQSSYSKQLSVHHTLANFWAVHRELFSPEEYGFILSLLVHVSHLEKSSLAVVIQIDEFLQSDHTCVITQVTEEECCQHPRGPCQDPPSYFLSPSSQWSPLSTLPTPPTSFVYLGA